ncbi:MAG: HD-GYP domain-containing protein [Aquabacterium sp.]
MKLLRLCLDQIGVGRPLPWNVYNDAGQLVLRQGYVVRDETQREALIMRGAYIGHDPEAGTPHTEDLDALRQNPALLWQDVRARAETLLLEPGEAEPFRHALQIVGGHIEFAVVHHLDDSLFELLHREGRNTPAVSHVIQAAFLVNMVAIRLGWPSTMVRSAVQAALTMNLASLRRQNALHHQATPLSAAERAEVAGHGEQGRQLLEMLGVEDRDWLQAVAHHHPPEEGRGLAAWRQRAGDMACLLHHVDLYLAKVSRRAYRAALPPDVAARQLFQRGGGAANPFASALIKEVGLFPPGAGVRLANGELAVVLRRGEMAHLPEVCSVQTADGATLAQPVRRRTSEPAFKVLAAVPRGVVTLPAEAVLH